MIEAEWLAIDQLHLNFIDMPISVPARLEIQVAYAIERRGLTPTRATFLTGSAAFRLGVPSASLSEAKAEIERLNLIIKKLQRSQFGRLRSESMTISCSSASKTSTPTLRAPKRAFRFPQ